MAITRYVGLGCHVLIIETLCCKSGYTRNTECLPTPHFLAPFACMDAAHSVIETNLSETAIKLTFECNLYSFI